MLPLFLSRGYHRNRGKGFWEPGGGPRGAGGATLLLHRVFGSLQVSVTGWGVKLWPGYEG